MTGSQGRSILSFLQKPPDLFPKCLYQRIFPPTAHGGPGYPEDDSPTFGIASLFNVGRFDGYVAYLCGFNLHFLNDSRCPTLFSRAYWPFMSSCMTSVQIFRPFLNWVVYITCIQRSAVFLSFCEANQESCVPGSGDAYTFHKSISEPSLFSSRQKIARCNFV